MPQNKRPPCCRDCGADWARFPHYARGYCNACYMWHRRHGFDRPRPIRPPGCVDCGRLWRDAEFAAFNRCTRCYWRMRRQSAA